MEQGSSRDFCLQEMRLLLSNYNTASSRMAIVTQHYSIPFLYSSSNVEPETGLCFAEVERM